MPHHVSAMVAAGLALAALALIVTLVRAGMGAGADFVIRYAPAGPSR